MHPDIGGTYTAQNLFRRAVDSYFIDIDIPGFRIPSESNFRINGSSEPFISFLKSCDYNFFSFIPENIKHEAKGVISHAGFLSHFSYAYQLSRHLDLPLYLVPHGFSDPYVFSYNTLKKKIWLELIGKSASNYATKIIYSSLAEKGKSLLPNAQSKGFICPWAVEPPPHLDRDFCRRVLREKLGLSGKDKILLYFSRIEKMKRPLETINSFLRVKPKGWKLLLVGPFEDKKLEYQIRDLVDRNSINIILHPPVFGKDKWSFLAGSDLYILMSHRENFGFTVAEAASVGLPIYISTGVDIHPYFESASRQMIFTLEKDCEIDDAISTLDKISDDDLCALGNYSRSVVDKNFSYQRFSQRLHNILDVHNSLTSD